VLIWFIALSFAATVAIFRDPAIDHRLVMAAAVLPAMLDLAVGGVPFLHTVACPVLVLGAVMLGTRGHRTLRRRLLAVPIGLFWNLVLDGMWTSTQLFAWPVFGLRFPDEQLPLLGRPLALRLVMEVVGLVVGLVCMRRFRLLEPVHRERFVRSGRLDRDLVGPSGRS